VLVGPCCVDCSGGQDDRQQRWNRWQPEQLLVPPPLPLIEFSSLGLVSYRLIYIYHEPVKKRSGWIESSYDEPCGEDEYKEGASDEEVARVPLQLDDMHSTENRSHIWEADMIRRTWATREADMSKAKHKMAVLTIWHEGGWIPVIQH
jgi:hypothetical protein